MYLHGTSLEIAHHQHAERRAMAHKDHLIAEARAARSQASQEPLIRLRFRAIVRRVADIPLALPRRQVACAASDVH